MKLSGRRNLETLLLALAFFNAPLVAIDVVVNVAGTAVPGYSGDGGAATSAAISKPIGVTEDSAGNIYFCDANNNRVRRIDAVTHVIGTIAGTGIAGFSGDNGPATAAQLNSPGGITLDPAGNVYISDFDNNRVRMIVTSNGNIVTVAGNGSASYGGDNGPALSAGTRGPASLAIDPIDGAFVFTQLNTSAIRRVDPATKVITTLCGNGTNGYNGDNILATSAIINEPEDLHFDAVGNLYFVDSFNGRIRKITRATGMLSTVAGNGTSGYSGDNGPATAASFQFSNNNTAGGYFALDSNGNFFVTDYFNQRIRYIDHATQIVTTIAGTGTAGYNGDVISAQTVQLNGPAGIFVEPGGDYVFADLANNLLRRVIRNAQTLPLSLHSISPARGGNSGVVTPTLVGTGFLDGATVILRRAGSADIAAKTVRNRFGIGLQATFDLTGQTLGVYDVIVTNPGGESRTLAGAFTVESGGAVKLTVDVVGSSQIRGGKQQAYLVVCGNQSNTDQYMLPLVVTFPKYCTLEPGFTLAHSTTQPSGVPPIDYTQVPLVVGNKDTSLVQLLIPGIPAGGVRAYAFRFTVPDTMAYAHVVFDVNASLGQPLVASAMQTQLRGGGRASRDELVRAASSNECARTVFNTAVACMGVVIPGEACAVSVATFAATTAVDFLILYQDPNSTQQDAAMNLNEVFLGAAQTAAVCAQSAIPGISVISGAGNCLLGIKAVADCGKPDNSARKSVESVVSHDPNDKSGPAGAGAAHYIARGTPMSYFVQFENQATATAAAQTVVITDVLDTASLDISTLSLGPISFADRIIVPPPGLSSFTTNVDLRPGKNLIVKVTAGLQSGTLQWVFDSLDPATMLPTTDPILGFLDPNKTPPQGEGGVLFTVQQKSNLAVGTVITNKASIVFDTNSPIETPTWSNTVELLGVDTDGDGFPDELEIAAGSDPANANSTPLGPGTFTYTPLTVTTLKIALNFAKAGKDSLTLGGTLLGLPNGFVLSGQHAQVYVGGVYQDFVLNAKGSAPKSKTATFALREMKKGAVFTCKLKQPLAAKFALYGLDGSATVKAPKSANRSIQVYVLFHQTFYGAKVPLIFNAKQGVSGAAKVGK